MLRILHVVGGMDRAGAETMIMNLYRNIDRNEIQFDFLYFKNKVCDYDEEINKLGGRIHRILCSNSLARTRKIAEFLKKNREYNIVHSHTFLNSGLNLLAARRAGVQNRIAHSHSTSNGSKGLINKIYEKLSIKLIKYTATAFFSCGREASRFLFPNNEEVIILPNAVDVSKLADVRSACQNYIEENIKQNSFLKVLQVGRLDSVKNHQFTIDLAIFMKAGGYDVKFFFAGQGPLRNAISAQIMSNGLEETVFLLGIRNDISELMAGADVLIMPSLFEGFPVVLAEAQAIGLRSVISDTISSEVDLQLNLINFISLKSQKREWVDLLTKSTEKVASSEIITKKLKENGFDAANNAQWLEKFYKNL